MDVLFIVSCTIYFLSLSGHVATGDQLHANVNTSAAYRAEKTLQGLFDYFWKRDTYYKDVSFVFVCAQIGLYGGGSCACSDPNRCLECFRWWSAVALESVATYGIYSNSSGHSNVPDDFFNHSPYNADYDPNLLCTYIDDFAWYGIAYLRVYEWLNVSMWH